MTEFSCLAKWMTSMFNGKGKNPHNVWKIFPMFVIVSYILTEKNYVYA